MLAITVDTLESLDLTSANLAGSRTAQELLIGLLDSLHSSNYLSEAPGCDSFKTFLMAEQKNATFSV
jgi:hypothetical protein